MGACLSAVMSVSSQQQEKGEKRTIYTCAQFQAPPSPSPHACWMGRVGEDWLEECPHLGSSPLPTPQPNCPVKWAKSTAGEFCIHRKLLRVDFTSRTHLQMGQPYKKKTHRRVQERIFHHVSCATAAPANPALYHQCPPDRRGVRRAPLMQRWGMKPRWKTRRGTNQPAQ